MRKTILLITLGLVVTIASALAYGSRRWQGETNDMHTRLEAARRPVGPTTYSMKELIGLPAPVQRYFRAALTDGQPMIVAVTVEHTGTLLHGDCPHHFGKAQHDVQSRDPTTRMSTDTV